MKKYTLAEAKAIIARMVQNPTPPRRKVLVWDKGFAVGVLKEIPMLYDHVRESALQEAAYAVVCSLYYREGVTDASEALDRMAGEPPHLMIADIRCYEMAPDGVTNAMLVAARARLLAYLKAKINSSESSEAI